MKYITLCIGLVISGQLIAMDTPEIDARAPQSPSSSEESVSPENDQNDILFKPAISFISQKPTEALSVIDGYIAEIAQMKQQLAPQDPTFIDLAKLLTKRDIIRYKSKKSSHKAKRAEHKTEYAKHKAQSKKEELRLLLVKEIIREGKEGALDKILKNLFE